MTRHITDIARHMDVSLEHNQELGYYSVPVYCMHGNAWERSSPVRESLNLPFIRMDLSLETGPGLVPAVKELMLNHSGGRRTYSNHIWLPRGCEAHTHWGPSRAELYADVLGLKFFDTRNGEEILDCSSIVCDGAPGQYINVTVNSGLLTGLWYVFVVHTREMFASDEGQRQAGRSGFTSYVSSRVPNISVVVPLYTRKCYAGDKRG